MMKFKHIGLFILAIGIGSCKPEPPPSKTLEVTATAYNSFGYQTQGDPTLTAFGDTLKPGMKSIAVSRDLLDSGLTHNTAVYIEELQDSFLVKDKMNRRWQQKIDIYFGTNADSAREWGKQKVKISWFEKRPKGS